MRIYAGVQEKIVPLIRLERLYAYETVAALIGNKLQNADVLLSNRAEFIQMVHSPSRLPKLPLRDLPWGCVVFIDCVGSNALRAAFDQKGTSPEAREEIISLYQATVADCAESEAGELAMAKGDSFLFAFQEPDYALRCALAIQESLAIKRPIFGPLGPLRVRMAIHSAPPGIGMQRLLEGAYQITNKALEGQVLISGETVQLVRASVPSHVKFDPLQAQIELDTGEEDPTPVNLFEVNVLVTISLQPEEQKSLFKQDPASKSGGGFQAFLVGLQERVTPENTLELTVRDRERIARYAHDYRGGGWQGRLRRIFGRTLGENLGRDKA